MTGRLDEAVEAMARVAYERAYPQGERESWESWSERVPWAAAHFRESVLAIAAALPAGVYRSDGRGTVEPYTEPRNVLPQVGLLMAELERTNNDLGSYGTGYEQALVDLREQLHLRFGPAALSATDTETSA